MTGGKAPKGGGPPTEGRLEVRIGGRWGTVCSGLAFTPTEAAAACAQLGFSGGGGAQSTDGSKYGGPPLGALVEAVSCPGDGAEPAGGLEACDLDKAFDEDCFGSPPVGLRCQA